MTIGTGGASPPVVVPGPAGTVARILSVLPLASTSPAVAETADGTTWVLKFSGAGPGPFGLLTEYLALGIARAFGAPVPAARPLWLPPGFPWMAGTDEFDSLVQRSAGWNLGIAFFADARPATPADLAEDPALPAIARADVFLQNVDRTARNPNLLVAGGALRAIDYDACLYLARALGPPRAPSTTLPAGHLLAGHPLPAGPAPSIDFTALVAPVPDAWLESAGGSHAALAARLDAAWSVWTATAS